MATSGKSAETDSYADVHAITVHYVLLFFMEQSCNSRSLHWTRLGNQQNDHGTNSADS